MVHHLAEGDRLTRSVLQPMLRGAERPPSDTELETRDRELLQAKEAADFAHLSRAATVQMLRRQSAEVSRTLREVSATDLDRVYTLWGETVLLREFIQRWIEDIGQHLAEMRSTLRTIPD